MARYLVLAAIALLSIGLWFVQFDPAGPAGPSQSSELERASALHEQAVELFRQGLYQQAIPVGEEALAVKRKWLGEQHREVADELSLLADIYRSNSDYSKAESALHRALGIYESSLTPDHPVVAKTLNNLGILYYALDQLEQAEPVLSRALALYKKNLGPKHPSVAQGLNNLGMLNYALGDYQKAETQLRQALTLYQRSAGATHPRVIQTRNNLAKVARAKERYARTAAADQSKLDAKMDTHTSPVVSDQETEQTLAESSEAVLDEPGSGGIDRLADQTGESNQTVAAEDIIPPPAPAVAAVESFEGQQETGARDSEQGLSPGNPVVQDLAPQRSGPVYPYSIQLGAFRTVTGRRQAMAEYRKRGFTPYWVRVELKKKGIWYRIFTGHFPNKAAARRFRREQGLKDSPIKKTGYANLLAVYESSAGLEDTIHSVESKEFSPYVITDGQGRSHLLVGAYRTKAGAQKMIRDLESSGFQSRVVKR